MKILFDTSVIIASIIESHPMHSRVFPWLKRAKSKEFEMLVASHTLAELYAVLTTLPLSPKITPGMARQLIHNNIETISKIVPLSSSDYFSVIQQMADLGLSGGVIYDALIAKVAQKSKVEHLLTFNIEDFKRIWPEGVKHIYLP
ncbi:MAG: type II toxin-antitoxin system VapC family toxin [Deltaproteobacteria bacterium]|nr:type II toxin-antitoxin system VapC family toxin [Deltaproteobacteria bacterium]